MVNNQRVTARQESKQVYNGSAFTLIELLVVISIIAVLMAIMMPALSKARENAKKTICQTNLHSIGMAISAYEADYKRMPLHYSEIAYNNMKQRIGGAEQMSDTNKNDVRPLWESYLKTLNVFKCPLLPELDITLDAVGTGTKRVYCDYFISAGHWSNYDSQKSVWTNKLWTRSSESWNYKGARKVLAGDRLIWQGPWQALRINHPIRGSYTKKYDIDAGTDYVITYSEIQSQNSSYESVITKTTANYLFVDGSTVGYKGTDSSLVEVPLPGQATYKYLMP